MIALTALALALLNAVNAGAFLAFSTMVSPALRAARDPRAAADVMRDMNVRAPRSIFMISFLGAPVVAIVAIVVLVFRGAGASPRLVVAIVATLLAFVVSAAVNIPWNERLVRDRGGDATWSDFSRIWPRANTVRLLLSLLAGAAGGATLL